MKKKRVRPLLTAGTSTLLLIFLSLCLLTFAALSFLSARTDQNLSKKMADRTTAYYNASNEANDRLEKIDELLLRIYNDSEDSETYFEKVSGNFKEFQTENQTLSFSVPLAEKQLLFVELKILYPNNGESFYSISQWKTVNTAEWIPDTRQNLYIQPD